MEPTTVQTFSIPPGFKLVSQNTQVGSKSSDQLVKLFGGVVFLLILVVVFMISRQNAQHNEKIKQMEVQQSAMVTPQLPIEPIAEVEVVPESTQESKIVSTSEPAPAVSTNGRCGPQFNNTICPHKRCCSRSSWCGGAQGTNSDWCSYSGNKGRDNGRYDGIG